MTNLNGPSRLIEDFQPTRESMGVQPNDPSRSGHQASFKKFFGPDHRYGVVAIHQEVDSGQGAVQWVVWDANSEEGYGPTVIRQADTVQQGVAGIGAN